MIVAADEPEVWVQVLPIITLVLGFAMKSAADVLMDTKASRRAEEQARRELQRVAIFQLQEDIIEYASAAQDLSMAYARRDSFDALGMIADSNAADAEVLVILDRAWTAYARLNRTRLRIADRRVRELAIGVLDQIWQIARGRGLAPTSIDKGFASPGVGDLGAEIRRRNDAVMERCGWLETAIAPVLLDLVQR